MAKYRKKPVVIDAEQFLVAPDGTPPRLPGMTLWDDVPGEPRPRDGSWGFVVTIHGQRSHVRHGDWIIPEPDGVHYYPVQPDIFSASYESVDGPG